MGEEQVCRRDIRTRVWNMVRLQCLWEDQVQVSDSQLAECAWGSSAEAPLGAPSISRAGVARGLEWDGTQRAGQWW